MLSAQCMLDDCDLSSRLYTVASVCPLRLLHSLGQHKSRHTGGGQWDQIWDILGKETHKLAKGLPWCSSG